MLEIEKFIQEHKEENWLELLTQKPYCLKYNEDEDYVLLKYDMINSDFTQPIVKECRGLIIDKHTLKGIALSFFKFFNIQEPLHDEIDWRSARTQEKVDGAKILLWFNEYKNKWQISTSGMLDSFKAPINDIGETYGDLFVEALRNINLTLDEFFTAFKPTYCYTFELVSPKARIVVPYKETKLYFIGLRDVGTFIELDPEIEENVIKLGIPRPKQYPLTSLEECMQATEKMGFDEEGFVVVDKDWHRVKIKSPEYVLAHRQKNNQVTMGSILKLFIDNKLDDFISIFPEYQEYANKVKKEYNILHQKIENALIEIKLKKFTNRKELAKYINANYMDISSSLFFLNDNPQFTFNDWFNSQTTKKQFKLLKLKELQWKKGIIYKHTCPNGKAYIGQTYQEPEKRWNNGKGYVAVKYFYNAIQKYGWENIKHEILEEIEFNDIKILNELEEYYILLYNTLVPNGYNLQTRGQNFIRTIEYRENLSKSLKGRKMSEDEIKKMGERIKKEWAEGKRNTKHLTTKECIDKRKKTFKERGCNIGEKNGMYGKTPHNKGIPMSEEQKQKLIISNKGKKKTEESKVKCSNSMSNLIWITNGKINHRIPKDSNIPDGYKLGRTLSEETLKIFINNGKMILNKYNNSQYKKSLKGSESPSYKPIEKEIIDNICENFKYLKDGLNFYNVSLYTFNQRYKEYYGYYYKDRKKYKKEEKDADTFKEE